MLTASHHFALLEGSQLLFSESPCLGQVMGAAALSHKLGTQILCLSSFRWASFVPTPRSEELGNVEELVKSPELGKCEGGVFKVERSAQDHRRQVDRGAALPLLQAGGGPCPTAFTGGPCARPALQHPPTSLEDSVTRSFYHEQRATPSTLWGLQVLSETPAFC